MEELQSLFSSQISLDRNQSLGKFGLNQFNIYYVRQGSLKISILNDGEEQIIRFGYQHDYVAFLDAFLLGESSIFSIHALKKTTLSVIQREDFDQYIQRSFENLMAWNKILEGLVVQQLEREMDLLIASPYERFQRVLKRSPKLF